MTTGRRPLLALVAGRILLFGAVAMAIEVAIVFAEYWFDDAGLGRSMIEIETERLAAGLTLRDGRLGYAVPATDADRYGSVPGRGAVDALADGYYVRVRALDGTVLYSTCNADCTDHLLPLAVDPPSFWQRSIAAGKPLSLAGGRSFDVGGRRVAIEIAVIRDPDWVVGEVIAHETFDHMVVPMTLMLTLVIGATIWSIRTALAPVARAAAQADGLDLLDSRSRLTTSGMPAEIATFASAVNRAFGRVGELVAAQKLFTSAIAHEIRTPAAIVRLEIEHIEDPRAKKALADLDGLTHVLEQLTALARLDAVDRLAFQTVDLSALVADTVAAMAPYVYRQGKTIAYVDAGATAVEAVPSLVETVIRNLVENAVRHTPAGTAVTVTSGPGPQVAIADDGPGMTSPAGTEIRPGLAKSSGGLGIGRRIVARIAEMHGAEMETAAGAPEGTVVVIRFRPSAPVADDDRKRSAAASRD